MIETIRQLSLGDWFAICTAALMGMFAIYGLFIRQKKDTREEGDKADDRLISLLKGTVEALEKKVSTLEGLQRINSKEIEDLKNENEVMKKILQGRDDGTVEYHKAGLEAMRDIKETLSLVTSNSKSMDRLTKIFSEHLEFMEKVMIEIKDQTIISPKEETK